LKIIKINGVEKQKSIQQLGKWFRLTLYVLYIKSKELSNF